jgi:hypothetical protein
MSTWSRPTSSSPPSGPGRSTTGIPSACCTTPPPLLKSGGGFAVYLYEKNFSSRFSDRWRVLTVRLPLRLVYVLSAVAIPLYYLYRVPRLGNYLQQLFPIAMWPHWKWRWLDTFDWYTPRYQWKHTYPEVFRWYREAGFRDIELFEFPVCLRGFKR